MVIVVLTVVDALADTVTPPEPSADIKLHSVMSTIVPAE
jgi:hypothetical protein